MTSRYGLEIRAATAADASGMVELLAEAGRTVDPLRLTERLIALREASGTVLLAVQWGPPSGLLSMHWYHTLAGTRPVAQITALLVAADARRQGIGRLLVKAAAQAARVAGCDEVEIATASGEASLQDFARSTGFAEAGPRFVRSLRKRG